MGRFGSSFVAVGALVSVVFPASSAFAFRADGEKPVEVRVTDKVRIPDATRQALLSASPAWSRFVQEFGADWQVTWDDRAGTPRSIRGGTIPLVSAGAGAAEVEAASRALLARLRPLSGVDVSLLRTAHVRFANGAWFVRFDRVTAEGVPVLDAYAELRVVNGNVVLLRLETHPGAEFASDAALDKLKAIGRANAMLRQALSKVDLDAVGTRVIAPVAKDGGWEYRAAWQVDSAVVGGTGRWRSLVDARDGSLLARESLVRWAVEGTVTANVEPRTVGDTLVALPMPHIGATVAGAATTADANGLWSSAADAPASVTVNLSGPWVHVNNLAGPTTSAAFTANAATANDYVFSAGNDDQQAEINAFRSTHIARAWALTVTPGLEWLQETLPVRVNYNDQCNAYWDGNSINFFREGSYCNNTGRIADVVYHEFGHGFHQNNAVSGVIDGAIGEGSGDYIAATITGSPAVGPNFMKNGDPVRELEGNRVYPDDVVGQVHTDGLIWGGAMWDLRKALIASHGEAAGKLQADLIFARVLATGPRLDQVYEEALLADDDDGDLANGTPNRCDIDQAFGLHGLTGASGVFSLRHQEITGLVPGGQAIAVTASKPETASLCSGTGIASASLRYRVDGGSVESVTLAASGEQFAGEIPAVPDGTLVRYWFVAQLEDGTEVTTPPAAPDNSFAFWVGPMFTVWNDDFEGELAWTHGGSRDDWQAGAPAGGADPNGAYSGTTVFGNDVGGDGKYQPGANNWAESPEIDCRGCRGTRLQFRRWLTVEDASYDHARILVNDEVVWQNPVGAGNGGAKPQDRIWSFEDIDISDVADNRKFTIRFELTSDEGIEYGGWTIDDVSIVAPGEPAPGGGGGGHGLFGCSVAPGAAASASGGAGLLAAAGALVALLRRRRRS